MITRDVARSIRIGEGKKERLSKILVGIVAVVELRF